MYISCIDGHFLSSITQRIKELNDPGGDLSGQLDTILDLFDEVQTKEVFGTRGPFTLFVPTENALALALSKSQVCYKYLNIPFMQF